jgi:hypothetical protein
MTTNRDVERLLDNWLAEGPTHVPDRVFDDAIARVYRQPQPSAWRPRWRLSDMTTPVRLLAAAAVVIALIGAGLFVLRPTPTVGPRPDPTATSAPSPTASLAPSPTTSVVAGAVRLPTAGPVPAGRYFVEKGPRSVAVFSFGAPEGWTSHGAGLTKHQDDSEREISWGSAIVDGLFADPCGDNETVPIGPLADDLLEGLASLPGVDVTDPIDVGIGNNVGRIVEMSVPSGFDVETCDPPIGLQVWLDRAGNYLVIGPGVLTTVITLDLRDGRFVFVMSRRATTPAVAIAEYESTLGTFIIDE